MAETENRYTRLAQKVGEGIVAKAEARAETMEIPMGMQRIRDRQAYARLYNNMSPAEKMAERARVGDDKVLEALKGGEE